MPNSKDLSIIIVSFNTKDLLKRCLSSIFSSLSRANFSYEVIVVENNSTDGSRTLVQHEFPQVLLVANRENVGFGFANNQATKLAKGKYLLFLNSDTEVLDHGIEKLYAFANKLHQEAIYGGKLYNSNYTPQASCGPFYTLPYVFLWLYLQGDRLRITRSSPNDNVETDWVSGACLLINYDLFHKLRGFDEKIFMYMDEVDLCYRAKKMNVPTIFFPQAKFLHVGSASSKDKKTPYINVFRGLAYFYQKHWPEELKSLLLLLKIKANLAIGFGLLFRKQSFVVNYRKALEAIKVYE